MFLWMREYDMEARLAAVDQDYHAALESCIDYWITNDSNPSMDRRNYLKLQDRLKMTFLYLVFTACRLQSLTGFLFNRLEFIIHDKTLITSCLLVYSFLIT